MATASAIDPSAAAAYTPGTAPANPLGNLQSSDFINLLVTQLQNQDPLQPMSNSDLLQQVSEIGSLQSQTSLTSTLQDMSLQNQISSASSMIGKGVVGNDNAGNQVDGVVTSIRVVNKAVSLELDSGAELPVGNVTGVTNVDTSTTTNSGV